MNTRSAPAFTALLSACLLFPPTPATAAEKGQLETRPSPALHRGASDVKGWAAETKVGAGGAILRVTNLNASGEGSFASAVGTEGRAS